MGELYERDRFAVGGARVFAGLGTDRNEPSSKLSRFGIRLGLLLFMQWGGGQRGLSGATGLWEVVLASLGGRHSRSFLCFFG